MFKIPFYVSLPIEMSLFKRFLLLHFLQVLNLWNINEAFKITYETVRITNSGNNCVKANQCEILKEVIVEAALNEIDLCGIRNNSKNMGLNRSEPLKI